LTLPNQKREDLFVVSKIWPSEIGDIEKAISDSLKKLQLQYLDLYLLHWPAGKVDEKGEYHYLPLHEIWPKLEKLVERGLVRNIGVSNF